VEWCCNRPICARRVPPLIRSSESVGASEALSSRTLVSLLAFEFHDTGTGAGPQVVYREVLRFCHRNRGHRNQLGTVLAIPRLTSIAYPIRPAEADGGCGCYGIVDAANLPFISRNANQG
jgi:hypothetical protein